MGWNLDPFRNYRDTEKGIFKCIIIYFFKKFKINTHNKINLYIKY